VGVSYVLDTNIIIYLLKGLLANPLPQDDYFVSVISEIELLSFGSMSDDDVTLVREFLSTIEVVDVSPGVRDAAIRLRREHKL
jgi:predicted nucleic acid-binding protein